MAGVEATDEVPSSEAQSAPTMSHETALRLDEVVAGLKSNTLVKVDLCGLHGGAELGRRLGASIEHNAQSGTLVEHINVANNCLSDVGAISVAPLLERATLVDRVEFNRNSLSGVGAAAILSALRHAPRLKLLSLAENEITDEGAIAIAAELRHMESTAGLSLSGNRIGEHGGAMLCDIALRHPTMRIFSVRNNPIGDQGAAALGAALPHSAVEMLYVNNCRIGPTGVLGLKLGLQQNKTLVRLYLNGNCIGNAGAVAIAEALPLSHIVDLALLDTQLGDSGATALAEGLISNHIMETLDLSENQIGDSGAADVAAMLQRNVKLQKLLMNSNRIGHVGASALARALGHNSSLRELFLMKNLVGTPGVTVLASAMKHKPTPISVYLKENQYELESVKALQGFLSQSMCMCDILETNLVGATGVSPVSLAEATVGLQTNSIENAVLVDNASSGIVGWRAFGDALQGNVSLRTLKIEDCPYGDHLSNTLGSSLPLAQSLSTLNLANTNFFADNCSFLASTLRTSAVLQELTVTGCHVSTAVLCTLADAMKQNECLSLRTLDLTNNQIGDQGASALAELLFKNETVHELYLCNNVISDAGATALCLALQSNAAIQVFTIRENKIDSTGMAAFGLMLNANASVTRLQLSGNSGGDTGAESIALALHHNQTLEHLDLCTNGIGDPGAKALALALRVNKTLHSLNLLKNDVSDTGAAAIYNALENTRVLRDALVLQHNCVHTLGVEFLNTRPITEVALSYEDIAWPPPSVSSGASSLDRSTLYRFMEAAAASGNLLVRSRLMMVGHGGAGKTTLKTALLMSPSDSAATLTTLRCSILDTIGKKWTEADLQSWVDTDLAQVPGFFMSNCPEATGITGARWLEYTHADVIRVFGKSESEAAKRVIRKMSSVLCFLFPDRSVETAAALEKQMASTSWSWVVGVVKDALDRSAPHFGDLVGLDLPAVSDNPPPKFTVEEKIDPPSQTFKLQPYGPLLDLPHVWTEGIELESWDEAGYTVWDMPGQMELYPAHQMFSASATAVYLLLVRANSGFEACEVEVLRWLSSLRSGLRGASRVDVRIVLSHTDNLSVIERQALLREVFETAERRFGNSFSFGQTCFATLYGEQGGGDPATGVDALRTEVLRLKSEGVQQYTMPTAYQQVCDDVVALARSAKLARWPLVNTTDLDCRDQLPGDVLGCLQDLGFLRMVGTDTLILEPVTWLSRIMAAFLHPYHGVARTIAGCALATTLEEHLQRATLTSRQACRIVNQRGRVIDFDNEDQVLGLLAHFDVCFELDSGRYIFPALLPHVREDIPFLKSGFCPEVERGMVGRRYTCTMEEDLIPATLASLLVEAAVRFPGHRAVYVGRCTIVAYSTELRSYFGVHQAADDRSIDIFATGREQGAFLGLMALQLSLLLNEHFPELALRKYSINPCLPDTQVDDDPFMLQTSHPLLGRCSLHADIPKPVEPHSGELENAAMAQPEFLWQMYRTAIGKAASSKMFQCTRSLRRRDSFILASWKESAVRRHLQQHCQPLCSWIDVHTPVPSARGEPTSRCPLRGLQVLPDLLLLSHVKAAGDSVGVSPEPESAKRRSTVVDIGGIPPHKCAVTFEVLQGVYDQARTLAGDDFSSWTMSNVNRAIVKPLCAQHGTCLALYHSPNGLSADVFVSHAWREPFKQFVESVFEAYRTSVRKPTLWICTFALMQSDDPDIIMKQIGPPEAPLTDAPFIRAMQQVHEFLVVRNSSVDVYSRLWCVCEVFFAHEYGLVPGRAKVAGSSAFSGSITSCLEARCHNLGDRVRILHALIGGASANPAAVAQVDQTILEFRSFAGDNATSV